MSEYSVCSSKVESWSNQMLLQYTWQDFLTLLATWFILLVVWICSEPSLVDDVATFSTKAAEAYRAACDRARPKIRNLWLWGGGFATASYVLKIASWPHANWTSTTLSPLLRFLAEFLLSVAFIQAADLMLRGGPIVGRFIGNQGMRDQLGVFGPMVTLILQNVNVLLGALIFAFTLIAGNRGEPTGVVMGIAGALAISRHAGKLSSDLDSVEELIGVEAGPY